MSNQVNIEGLERITLGELHQLVPLKDASIRDVMQPMREFRDRHGLTDQKALQAFGLAMRIWDR